MDTRLGKPPDNDHEWFRGRLPDHLLDLLEEGERRRFEAHARRCPGCARLLASALGARADWWDGAGHTPVGVLLDWNPSARGEPIHEAVRAHLAACEDCRRDLSDLRGEPLLSEVAPDTVRPTPAPARRPAFRWGSMAAAAATLVAVTAILVVRPRDSEREPGPPRADRPAAPAPWHEAPVPEPATVPDLAAEPVEIAAAERGQPGRTTVIRLRPGIARVPLTLPALAAPDGVVLEIELRDAAGATVTRQWLAAERALRPGGVELAAANLAEGTYVLAVRWIDPLTGEDSREFTLDVRSSRQ